MRTNTRIDRDLGYTSSKSVEEKTYRFPYVGPRKNKPSPLVWRSPLVKVSSKYQNA